MPRPITTGVALATLAFLAGCGSHYSPDTYSAAAVQQANKVQRGVVVGVRNVGVSADSTVGMVTGAAAGGIVGSQAGTGGPITALTTLGGTVVGGLIGTSVQHASGDTYAYEYVVRQDDGTLVSVTQKDKAPLEIGQTVLVIAGKQARIVPDYTVAVPNELPTKAAAKPAVAASQPAAPAAPVTPAVPAGNPPAQGGGAVASQAPAGSGPSAEHSGAAAAATAVPGPPGTSPSQTPPAPPGAAPQPTATPPAGASPSTATAAAGSVPATQSAPVPAAPPAATPPVPAAAEPGAPVSLAQPASPSAAAPDQTSGLFSGTHP